MRDLYARKLVGWAMSETRPQALTLCALDVALGWRDPDAGRVHHSDRGSQYAAKDYRKQLAARGITVSMSRKGGCWDNAPMESVNGTLKVECVQTCTLTLASRRGQRSSNTSVTTIPSGATPRWATSHRRNSSGAGAPRPHPKTRASRLRSTVLPTEGRFPVRHKRPEPAVRG